MPFSSLHRIDGVLLDHGGRTTPRCEYERWRPAVFLRRIYVLLVHGSKDSRAVQVVSICALMIGGDYWSLGCHA